MIGKGYPHTREQDLAQFISKAFIGRYLSEQDLSRLLVSDKLIWNWEDFVGGVCSGGSCDFEVTEKNLAKLNGGIGICPACDELLFVATAKYRYFGSPLYDSIRGINLLVMPDKVDPKKKAAQSKTRISGELNLSSIQLESLIFDLLEVEKASEDDEEED